MPGALNIVSMMIEPVTRSAVGRTYDRDHRNQCVAHHVPADHDVLAQALCSGSPHVIILHDLEHAGSGQPRHVRHCAEAKHYPGEDVGRAEHALPRFRSLDRRDVELAAHEDQQKQSADERRHGNPDRRGEED